MSTRARYRPWFRPPRTWDDVDAEARPASMPGLTDCWWLLPRGDGGFTMVFLTDRAAQVLGRL